MASYISPGDLEKRLLATPWIHDAQASSPVDLVAALVALADVESAYRVDAAGDGGASLGLWQINSKVHQVDPGRMADVGYQIDAVEAIWHQANESVLRCLQVLQTRGAVEHQSPDSPDPAMRIKRPVGDVITWYSIAWQYGPGDLHQPNKVFGLENWIAETFDTSAAGFAAYRRDAGHPVLSGFYSRQDRYLQTYTTYSNHDRPDWWTDVVVKTGKDVAALPSNPKVLGWVAVILAGVGLWLSSRRRS
jgi:hypothetical protein